MSTNKLHPIQESIRAQLGLEPEENAEPEGGMKAWLSEFEPGIHASLYAEDEDEDGLTEDSELLDESNYSSMATRQLKRVPTEVARLAKFAGFSGVKGLPEEEQKLIFTLSNALFDFAQEGADMVQEVAKGARGSLDPTKKANIASLLKKAGYSA
jgi:hypothetical protein